MFWHPFRSHLFFFTFFLFFTFISLCFYFVYVCLFMFVYVYFFKKNILPSNCSSCCNRGGFSSFSIFCLSSFSIIFIFLTNSFWLSTFSSFIEFSIVSDSIWANLEILSVSVSANNVIGCPIIYSCLFTFIFSLFFIILLLFFKKKSKKQQYLLILIFWIFHP